MATYQNPTWFKPWQPYAVGTDPIAVQIADLGNGHPDTVALNAGSKTGGVLPNTTERASLAARVVSTPFGGALINGVMPPGGAVSIILTNTSNSRVTGGAGITVFACTNGSIDQNQTAIARSSSFLNIGSRKTTTVQLPVDLASTGQLSIGVYTLLAEVIDPYGNTIDETAGPTLKVVPLAPVIPPPNPADTFVRVIGSAHGTDVPLVWRTAGPGVGSRVFETDVRLTGGIGTVYTNTSGSFDLELTGRCSLTIESDAPQYLFPNLDLGTVDVQGSLVRLNAASSSVTGPIHVQGSVGTAILKNITGSLLVSGSIGNLRAGDVSGDISAGQTIGTVQLGHVSGNIAAGRRLGSLVAMSLTNAKVLAGATITDAGAISNPAPGTIDSIRITEAVTQSFIGAGVDPRDGLYGNGNDTRFRTGPSDIRYLDVASVDASSLFEAAIFRVVQFYGKTAAVAGDPRFHVLH